MTAAEVGLDAAAATPTFRSVLRYRRLRRLLIAHVAGTVAQQVLTLAVGLYVLERTSSGLWVSVTVALAFAPYALLSGYAGTLADRCSRSAVLAWSGLIRVGCAGVLTVALALDWALPIVVLVAAIAAVAATPSYPALAAATPQCVPDSGLPAANALVTGLENVGWIAGPGCSACSCWPARVRWSRWRRRWACSRPPRRRRVGSGCPGRSGRTRPAGIARCWTRPAWWAVIGDCASCSRS